MSHITGVGRVSERVGEQGATKSKDAKWKRQRAKRERERGRGSLAANAWSRLLFSVMAQNDISMIRKNKPTK